MSVSPEDRAATPRPSGLSRLERMIRRLRGQRACLEQVAGLIAGSPGPVLEVGLGKGRTYDHLRRLLPDRDIYVFDRAVHCPPDCVPDDAHLLLGEFIDTLPGALERVGARPVLANCDFGKANPAADAELAAWLGPTVGALMAPGGYVISDQPLEVEGWETLPLPEGAEEGRIHLYRVPG
jgi:hypothetical protein